MTLQVGNSTPGSPVELLSKQSELKLYEITSRFMYMRCMWNINELCVYTWAHSQDILLCACKYSKICDEAQHLKYFEARAFQKRGPQLEHCQWRELWLLALLTNAEVLNPCFPFAPCCWLLFLLAQFNLRSPFCHGVYQTHFYLPVLPEVWAYRWAQIWP